MVKLKYLFLIIILIGNQIIFANNEIPIAQKKQCILNYFKSISGKKIISGQYTNVALNIETAYQHDIVGLYNKTNKWVGIIGVDYQRNAGGLPQKMHETNQRVIEYFKNGGLVTMFCSFSNPWTNKGLNDTTGRYQIMDLIDPSKPVHSEWLKRLDSVAVGLNELQDSGVVVLYRFFFENNGFWFWWGTQTPELPTPENWVKLWKFTYNYFTVTKNLKNILWVFAPSAKESANKNPYFKPDLYYYPGNDYVDIVGTSVYNDTLDIPYYDELKATGKPIVLTEFGPGRVSREGNDYDYSILINQIKTKYPEFVYWVSWNDFITNGGKDTVNYSPLNQKNGKELLENEMVINREGIDWQNSCNNSSNNGPWNSPLKIAISNDGINFNNEKIFQDSAGVPSVVRWKGDTLVCVFQWFRQPMNSPSWDRVAVKYSYNGGYVWTEPVPIIINGLPQNYQRPFDPTLAITNDNKIRIYYSSSDGIPQGMDNSINTYSAISNDGINYTFENGTRYDNPNQRVIDPAVAYFKNEWHYFSPIGAPQDGAFHCTSSDGLTFVEKANIQSDNTHNWTGNFLVENNNELRFYGCGANLWLNKSSDGYSWNSYQNTNLTGGDPSVVKLSNGKYIMIYVGQPYNNTTDFPGKVVLVSPQNNSHTENMNIDIIWNKGKLDITNYHLQVSLRNNFQSYEVNDSILADTLFNFTNLEQDSVYYWRVRAKNKNGWGVWSDVWRFGRKDLPDSLFSAIPLTDMGNEKWKNYSGGLYPDGENEIPNNHKNDGIEISNSIVPLNNSGKIDDNGKIILLSIGMSNTTQEFTAFKMLADTFKLKNPNLIIVDGAQGGQTASIIKDSSAQFWKTIEQRLTQQNLTPEQVQVVWLKEANHTPTEAFPIHAEILKNDLKAIVLLLKIKYPNLKIAYISSRTYGGYATTTLNPEPFAYESGFSVKWLIEEQLNKDSGLEYSGNSAKAPWLAWGPYLWTSGTTPRSDGLIWLRDDCAADGTHPSNSGRLKVANMLLNFLSTDETSTPWFLRTGTKVEDFGDLDNSIILYPNPAGDYIEIKFNNVETGLRSGFTEEIRIYNTLGECVVSTNPAIVLTPTSFENGIREGVRIDISEFTVGLYFLEIRNKIFKFVKI